MSMNELGHRFVAAVAIVGLCVAVTLLAMEALK
mgnify:CR=1 FL=1